MFIAIVCSRLPEQTDYTYGACYISSTREAAIRAAIIGRSKLEQNDRLLYRIFAGELTTEVAYPAPEFIEVPLKIEVPVKIEVPIKGEGDEKKKG